MAAGYIVDENGIFHLVFRSLPLLIGHMHVKRNKADQQTIIIRISYGYVCLKQHTSKNKQVGLSKGVVIYNIFC